MANRAALGLCVAAALLADCGTLQAPISAPGVIPQSALGGSMMQHAPATCTKSPPQYWWIFGGACDRHVTLQSNGGRFGLAEYDAITVEGEIGHNTAKGTATITIADATDTNGDVAKWNGKAFPKYVGRGKTFLYAVAINESNQVIRLFTLRGGPPVLRYVVTDAKGLPGKTCDDAVLLPQRGHFRWYPLPDEHHAKGNTVTLTQPGAPAGFELPPKVPIYFAVQCYS
jgi:hypothetical protein